MNMRKMALQTTRCFSVRTSTGMAASTLEVKPLKSMLTWIRVNIVIVVTHDYKLAASDDVQ